MKKLFESRKTQNIKIAIFLILFSIISFKLINNIEWIYQTLANVFNWIVSLLVPFIIGAIVALLLNSSVNFIEKQIRTVLNIKHTKKNKFIRIVAVTLTYLVSISIISIIIIYLVPTIKESMIEFKNTLPTNIQRAERLLSNLGYDITIDLEKEVMNVITTFVQTEGNIYSLLVGVANITSTLFNAILGLIIAFYILIDKEDMYLYIKRLLLSFFSIKNAKLIMNFGRYARETFDNFLVGKILDSLIIGCIAYIGFYAMGIKYSVLFSVIIGITNVIPYFGPFMGGIPVCLLVFLDNPNMFLPVGLFILILQQVDGNIIGPKILGDAIGVRPISIIFAIMIGGALGGVLGMLFAVPTFVIINDLLINYIDKRYRNKMKGSFDDE